MIESSEFLSACKTQGLNLFTGTPCSYLKPFINFVIDDPELEFIGTTNEGDAVALASGAWLGGKLAVVMFQNSGLGNAVNPLTSLSYTSQIPLLGITTLRGEPGGKKDEPQHELMGQITTEMLNLMKIPWAYFPEHKDEIDSTLKTAMNYMTKNRMPYFLVMKDGSVNAYELKSKGVRVAPKSYQTEIQNKTSGEPKMIRTEALKLIRDSFGPSAAYIATTGKTGREMFEVGDTENQFYMVGSMGCALPIGLGMVAAKIKNKTVVIDGDGALMMRMGNMALAGQMKPENIVHILLDNAVHDSTGGQKTMSETIDFATIAKACGYKHIFEVDDLAGAESALKFLNNQKELGFVRFSIKKGSPEKLGRPTVTPAQVAERLRNFIAR
jgi:phosphonopyruvate decarboxylase